MASATADFERIYRRHARDVYRFALSVVRNPLEAEDVTQTTFMNAYRALARGDRPERPRSWLFAIAHNAIRSRDRRLRRPPEVPLEVAEYRLAESPDESPPVDDLLRALGDLPESQRDALAMRELQGQTYPEIAEVLGLSVSAVESLIARARRALRAQRERLAGIAVLRRLSEQGNGDVSALAAKVSVVAAAATAVAGGMAVETHVAGPTPAPVTIASRAAAPIVASTAGPRAAAASRTMGTAVQATPAPPPPAVAAPASTAAAAPASASASTAADAAQTTTASVATTTATTSVAVTEAVTSSAAVTLTTVAAAMATTPTVTAPTLSTPTVPAPIVSTPTVALPPLPPPPTVPLP